MQPSYNMTMAQKGFRDISQMGTIESLFSTLVSALKELELTKKQAFNQPNAAQILQAACDEYCSISKKTLRSTIQTVDRMVEEYSSSQHARGMVADVNIGSPKRTTLRVPRNHDILINLVVKSRSHLLTQRVLDHWKMYCVSHRLKKTLDARHNDMALRLEHAEKRAETAQADMRQTETRDTRMQDELRRARAENATLVDKLSRTEDRISDFQKQLQAQATEHENLKATNKRLMLAAQRSKIITPPPDDSNDRLRALQTDLRILNEQLGKANETTSELSNKLVVQGKEAEKSISLLKARLETITRERDQLQSSPDELERLKKMSDELRSENSSLRTKLAKATQDLSISEADVHQYSVDLKQADEELEKNANEITQLHAKIASLERMEAELERRKTSPTEVDSHHELHACVTEKVILDSSGLVDNQLTTQINTLRAVNAQLATEKAEQTAQLNAFHDEIDSLETRLQEYQEICKSADGMHNELERRDQRINSLENQIAELQEEIVELNKELVSAETSPDLETERRHHAREIERLKSQLESSRDELIALEKDLETQQRHHEQKIEEITSRLMTAESGRNQLEAVKGDLETERREHARESETLKSRLATAESSRDQLIAVKKDLETELLATNQSNKSTPRMDCGSEEKIQSLKMHVSQLESEISQLHVRLSQTESLISEKDKLIQSLKTDTQRVTVQLEKSNSLVSELSSQMNLARSARESEVEQLAKQVSTLSRRNSALESQITPVEEINGLKDQIQSLRARESEQENAIKTLSLRLSQTQQIASALESEKATLVQQIERLSTPARISDTPDLTQLRSQLAEKERALRVLETRSIESGKQAASREVELLAERVSLSETIDKLRKDLSNKSHQISTIVKLVGAPEISIEDAVRQLVNQIVPTLALQPLSQLIELAGPSATASYIGPQKDDDMCGCLITHAALPSFPEGVYFEVRVARTNSNNPDGITVGVTLTPPWHGPPVPNTLDDIPLSWAAGYNGQTWNSAKGEWKDNSWCGKDLVPGQRVGVLIAIPPVNQMFVFVDDLLVCKGPNRMPDCLENSYYGLVDLLGNCDGVTLLWQAKPPLAALDLVPVAQQRTPNVPRLALKPTRELSHPVRPPSAASSEAGGN
jgi:cell division protein ZapA